MILNAILILTGVAAVASVVGLLNKGDKSTNIIPMEMQLPGNLPIISLSDNNGITMNFIIDSGSNISHICSEYLEDIDAELIGTYKEGEVAGLGANNIGVTICETTLKDVLGHEYNLNLSVSDQLSVVAKTIERNTGVQIHGLLGTDFLKRYNYVIDFKSLAVYPNK